jgi:hypothetical protein
MGLKVVDAVFLIEGEEEADERPEGKENKGNRQGGRKEKSTFLKQPEQDQHAEP